MNVIPYYNGKRILSINPGTWESNVWTAFRNKEKIPHDLGKGLQKISQKWPGSSTQFIFEDGTSEYLFYNQLSFQTEILEKSEPITFNKAG